METLRRKGGVSFEISVQFGKLETGFTQGKGSCEAHLLGLVALGDEAEA